MTANRYEIVRFHGAKGGVGTTVCAALYSLEAAAAGFRVALTASTARGRADLGHLFGETGLVFEMGPDDGPRLFVIDYGVGGLPDDASLSGQTFLVTSLAYGSVAHLGAAEGAIIVVAEEGRSLRPSDVENVAGREPVAVVTTSTEFARRIDAGLLVPPAGLEAGASGTKVRDISDARRPLRPRLGLAPLHLL